MEDLITKIEQLCINYTDDNEFCGLSFCGTCDSGSSCISRDILALIANWRANNGKN